jgi:hypothetical protein
MGMDISAVAATRASQAYRQAIELDAPTPLQDGALLGVASAKLGWKLRQRKLQHLLRVRLEHQGYGVWLLREDKTGKPVAVLTEAKK